MRSCDNCYWQDYKDKWCIHQNVRPKEDVCGNHSFTCESCGNEQAQYTYEGKKYCPECLLEEYEVEEATVTHYYQNGEYLGSSDSMEEVISNLDRRIKPLDD